MEHHSTLCPGRWSERTGASLKVIPITDAGELDMAAFHTAQSKHQAVERSLDLQRLEHGESSRGDDRGGPRWMCRFVSAARRFLTLVWMYRLSLPAWPSGSQTLWPNGSVSCGASEICSSPAPYRGGGDMIESVSEKTTYAPLPTSLRPHPQHRWASIGVQRWIL